MAAVSSGFRILKRDLEHLLDVFSNLYEQHICNSNNK